MGHLALIAWMAITLGPFLAWAAFRGPGYKRRILDEVPAEGTWRDTGERFTDGRDDAMIVAVWTQEGTGERAYVRRRTE